MQQTTLLALFWTIVLVFLVGVHDCAPTKKPKGPVTTTPTVSTTVSILPGQVLSTKPLPGARSVWQAKVDAKSKKIFNDYKKIIVKKLQAVHKVPATFKPKPAKTSSQVVAGLLHHYLVKLPSNKYAHVTIIERAWLKAEYGQEQHVTVRPDLYDRNGKNI